MQNVCICVDAHKRVLYDVTLQPLCYTFKHLYTFLPGKGDGYFVITDVYDVIRSCRKDLFAGPVVVLVEEFELAQHLVGENDAAVGQVRGPRQDAVLPILGCPGLK